MLCFALHSTLPKFALVNYIHTMKKSFFAISIISLLLLLFSCNSDFKVTYLEICPAQLTTTVGDTVQMTFSIVYEGGDFNDPNLIQVAWSSSDDAIVAAKKRLPSRQKPKLLKIDFAKKFRTVEIGSRSVDWRPAHIMRQAHLCPALVEIAQYVLWQITGIYSHQ